MPEPMLGNEALIRIVDRHTPPAKRRKIRDSDYVDDEEEEGSLQSDQAAPTEQRMSQQNQERCTSVSGPESTGAKRELVLITQVSFRVSADRLGYWRGMSDSVWEPQVYEDEGQAHRAYVFNKFPSTPKCEVSYSFTVRLIRDSPSACLYRLFCLRRLIQPRNRGL